MTRILIVDDERLARVRIRRFLDARYPEAEVREAADAYDALELMDTFLPELILLDVEMPELSGFDFLRQTRRRDFQVIFQTAYDEFAVRAFEVNACDYLLKPFSDERLDQALRRAVGRGLDPERQSGLDRLDAHLSRQGRYLDRFAVKLGNRYKLVEQDDVLCFSSESHCTRLVLGHIDYVYDHSLQFLEERLDPERFLRIHRNCIVQVRQVAGFSQATKLTLTLRNGMTLPVARNRVRKVLSAIDPSRPAVAPPTAPSA